MDPEVTDPREAVVAEEEEVVSVETAQKEVIVLREEIEEVVVVDSEDPEEEAAQEAMLVLKVVLPRPQLSDKSQSLSLDSLQSHSNFNKINHSKQNPFTCIFIL